MPEIDVKQKVLAANQAAATSLRESSRDQRTLVVNLISSPGSGKTTLLEATVARLAGKLKMGGLGPASHVRASAPAVRGIRRNREPGRRREAERGPGWRIESRRQDGRGCGG